MMTQKNIIKEQQLYIRDIPVDIIIDEEINFPITLKMPLLEELMEIKKLSIDKISIKDTIVILNDDLQDSFKDEYDKLFKKYDKFKYSSTYLNHLATISMFTGNIDGMRKYLGEAYNINSNSYFKNKMIASLIINNEVDEAKKQLLTIKNKDDVKANNNFALLSIKNKEFPEAEKYIKNSLNSDIIDFNTRLLAGSIDLIKGNIPQAIRHFRVALEQEETSYFVYLNLSIAYIIQNNLKKALSSIQKAYALNPIEKNIIIIYSSLLINYNCYEKAVKILKSYLEFDQKIPVVWDLIAKAYFKLKDYSNAIESLKHQASIEDNNAIWNNIAIVYWAKGDKEKAFEYFSLAIKNWSNNHKIPEILLLNFSNFLLDLKSYEEVRAIFNKYLPLIIKSLSDDNKKLFHLLLNYAEANFHLDDVDNTIKLLEEIITKYNLDIDTKIRYLINITFYYSMIKPDISKAIHYCDICFVINEKNDKLNSDLKTRFLNNLAFCLIESSKFREAENILNKLSSSINALPYPTATLGLLNIKKGNIKKGMSLYEKAIGLSFDKNEKDKFRQKLYYELAKHYSGDVEKSKDYYQKALKCKSGFKYIEEECKKALKI